MDLDQPYLKRQLIAYIGNKRALQPFLLHNFGRLIDPTEGRKVFLDPFAGSGSVARLARSMGFQVLANDWEFYAYVLNTAHLQNETETRDFYQARGGLARGSLSRGGREAVFQRFNDLCDLCPPAPPEGYISRYYAPADTETADYKTERLFYTRENALIIDAVRNAIEDCYPALEPEGTDGAEKFFLLASLLYQCATHTNTSGVFKACHKGFGGHGRDALKRILSPIRLQIPLCIDAPYPAQAFRCDAADFVRKHSGDICYLDPPYNQHQYGSNYHLLNTIARWDKPDVKNDRRSDGSLKHKAAIRSDWVETRSPYCYRGKALTAFERLLDGIDARFIVLSYNSEGIIPFEALLDTMAGQGRLSMVSNDYVKYRGGKQSIGRQVYNVEVLLLLDRDERQRTRDWKQIENQLALKKTALLLKRSFIPEEIQSHFDCLTGDIVLAGRKVLPMPDLYRFDGRSVDVLKSMSREELEELSSRLSACECGNREQEIEILLSLVRKNGSSREYTARILRLLKKFAHKKYRSEFTRTLSRLKVKACRQPELFGGLATGLAGIEELARIRFQG